MDRRIFLTTAGAAGAALAVPTILTPRKASATVSVNPAPYNSCGTLHAVAAANYFRGDSTAKDWTNIEAALKQVASSWKSYNLDSVLKPGFNTVTESMITPSKLNLASILKAIQVYYPSATQAELLSVLNPFFSNMVVNGVDYKSKTLDAVRSSGLYSYIEQMISMAGTAATFSTKQLNARAQSADILSGPTPDVSTPCQLDSLALIGFGVGLTVLTVMTDGLDLLAWAGWDAISYWGGIGVTGWSIMHAYICGL